MNCPVCASALQPIIEPSPAGRIELDFCERCRGVWFDAGELAAVLNQSHRQSTEVPPLLEGGQPARPCPYHPETLMRRRALQIPDAPAQFSALVFDQCPKCEGVWLEGVEVQKAVSVARKPFSALDEANAGEQKMRSPWFWLFQFLTGFPVEQWNPSFNRPVMVPVLIVLCMLSFVYEVANGPTEVVEHWGLVPSRFLDGFGVTLLTYMFLHGSPWHLLANMYFLWVFGDNVEDRLGRVRFSLLYLGSGVLAGLIQALLTSQNQVPAVGASGAIAGVMAAYALLFPRTRLISLILFWRVRWHASVYLGFWLLLQCIGAAIGTGEIAFWAHVGGFGAGALIALAMRPARLNPCLVEA